MFAHRSIYHDGWRAVCPVPGTSFTEAGIGFGQMEMTEDKLRELDAKGWELYNLTEDFAETKNLAETNRPKLIEMIALWYAEAGKYNVLPLDSRGHDAVRRRAAAAHRRAEDRTRTSPARRASPDNVAAKVLNRAHSLTAEVEIPKGGAEGVIVCHGSNVGGYTMFVKDGKLNYVHNYVGAQELRVVSNENVPEGKVTAALRVRADRQA